MRRGDICFADLEPIKGSEANKRRPVVVVSNDQANASAASYGRGVITVVPLTSNTKRVLSFQVLLKAADTGLIKDSKAQAEQIRSLDVTRLGAVVGSVPPHLMGQIDDAMRLHLRL